MTDQPSLPHRRRSIRLPGFDYTTDGAYFITLVTQGRIPLFGKIQDSDTHLNQTGRIVEETWLWLAKQYSYVELGEYCVMPNHFHGILIVSRTPSNRASTVPASKIKPLGQLIGAYKTTSTKAINNFRNSPGAAIWQRNYYEHIIRGETDFEKISSYIFNNPLNWDQDEENPRAPDDPFILA